MSGTNTLFKTPPFALEQAMKRLGENLRTARLRRNITISEMAQKIGAGPRLISDAEKGKLSTGIAAYGAILWVFGLLDQLEDLAAPENDPEGQALALLKEPKRARQKRRRDDDF